MKQESHLYKKINYKKFYDKNNPYMAYWQISEKKYPKYYRNIKTIEYKNFKKKYYNNENTLSKKKLVKSLLSGDIYILKNAITKQITEKIKKYTITKKFKKKKFSFHKIVDGVPNFSRYIDQSLANKYAFLQVKMTSYYFPFNEKNEKLKIYKIVYPLWRVIKHISGFKFNELEKNIPSDGIIDRLQVVRYPLNEGYLEPHTDPHGFQKFFISIYLSKKGKDFQNGGFYSYKNKNRCTDIENKIDIGDLCFGMATIKHEVKIATGNGIYRNSDLRSGRWFVGLYTTETNYVKKRRTSSKAK